MSESNRRRRLMESQLRRLDVDYTIISAIDGKSLPESSFREFSDIRFQRRHGERQFLAAEVGCSLSHMKAYRKMLEAGHSHAVILEDDVLLDRDIRKHVEEVARTMSSADPEIILLSPINSYFLDGKTIIDRYQVVDVASARLAWGYIINARAARLLMQRNFPVRFLADDWKRVRYYTGCEIRAVLPALVGEHLTARDSHPPALRRSSQRVRRLRRPMRLRSRLLQVPLRLSMWLDGLLRRKQNVTQAQTRLRRPPLTSVPTDAAAQVARD